MVNDFVLLFTQHKILGEGTILHHWKFSFAAFQFNPIGAMFFFNSFLDLNFQEFPVTI